MKNTGLVLGVVLLCMLYRHAGYAAEPTSQPQMTFKGRMQSEVPSLGIWTSGMPTSKYGYTLSVADPVGDSSDPPSEHPEQFPVMQTHALKGINVWDHLINVDYGALVFQTISAKRDELNQNWVTWDTDWA